MFIAFLPLQEAHELLEEAHQQECSRSEIEAELGSSYFYGGASSWDASSMARTDMLAAQEDFDQGEDAPLYYGRLEAARFMADATHGLGIATEEEIRDYRVFVQVGAPRVPEFYPYGGAPEAPVDLFALPFSINDIPF